MKTALLNDTAADLTDADTDTLIERWCEGGRGEWEEAVLRRELRERGLSGLVLRGLASQRATSPDDRASHPPDAGHVSLVEHLRRFGRRLGGMLWRARTRRRRAGAHLA